jgi:hypothetical protein
MPNQSQAVSVSPWESRNVRSLRLKLRIDYPGQTADLPLIVFLLQR